MSIELASSKRNFVPGGAGGVAAGRRRGRVTRDKIFERNGKNSAKTVGNDCVNVTSRKAHIPGMRQPERLNLKPPLRNSRTTK